MDINLFDYELPEELIAQSPLKDRDKCKLLVVDRNAQNYTDLHFLTFWIF